MKKTFFLITAVLSMATAIASAKGPIDFGIKAGINTGNFKLDKENIPNNVHIINDARTGFHAGAFMRLNLLGIQVQPEMLYNWNKYDMTILGASGESINEKRSQVSVQTLEVPVLGGLEILFLRLNAGPVFNIMNKTSVSGKAVADAEVIKPSVSFAAGVGLDLMSICFDVRYNGQFRRADNTITIDQNTYDLRSNFQGWTFSIGYKF